MRGGSERVSRQLLDCLTSAPPVLCVVPRPTIGVMVGEDGGRCAPGLLAALCPRGVVCVEERGEGIASDPAVVLLPGEEARIARALPARVHEYVRGRRLAHEALARMGRIGPVLSGRLGEPVWPDGVIGSITHCPGLCAAAVAERGRWAGLGIDAEPCRQLGPGVARALVMAGDQLLDGDLGLSVLLSVKEASSKAMTSATAGVWDFRRFVVSRLVPGSFRAIAPDGMSVTGRWCVREGFVLAVAVLPVTTP